MIWKKIWKIKLYFVDVQNQTAGKNIVSVTKMEDHVMRGVYVLGAKILRINWI